jgi:capsular polysaccharide transport system permease protein
VSDYIKSSQIIVDAMNEQSVDFRSFFSKPDVDFYYSVDPDMPFEKFVSYWRHMAHVEFNSTTGITTFRVKAFSAKDAYALSKTVVQVSERLVNKLSDNARKQLISTAQEEVNRTEDRLKSARRAVEDFRNKEQALDPQLVAQSEQSIIRELQVSLADAQARRNALAATTRDSPTLRVLDRQISAFEQQIEEQKKRVGSGSIVGPDGETSNLSRTYTAYGALLLEQEFAEKAYTGAQTALEQAMIEARKQDRYFAIIVEPTYPDAALYPYRTINTILVFAAATLIWLLGYLIIQSVRDHAI